MSLSRAEISQRYRDRHPGMAAEISKRYRARFPEKARALVLRWYHAHRAKVNEGCLVRNRQHTAALSDYYVRTRILAQLKYRGHRATPDMIPAAMIVLKRKQLELKRALRKICR
jgi:hypothetical protein